MRISIDVAGKVATVKDGAKIVCGNSDYEIAFTFDDEWSADGVKTARFTYQRHGKTLYSEQVFTGNVCPVPVLYDILEVCIGVYEGDLSTSTPAVVECERSILCGSPVHDDPPKDVYNQIVELCDEAVNTAKSVEERADNGEFDGEDGYTPVKGVDYYTEEEKAKIIAEAKPKWKTLSAGSLDSTTGGVASIKAEITEDISNIREFNLCLEFKATAEMDGKTAYLNANINGTTLNNCIYTTTSDTLKSGSAYKSISHISVIKSSGGYMVQGVHSKMSANMGVNSRGNAVGSMSPWEITAGAKQHLNINISSTTFPAGTRWVLEGR